MRNIITVPEWATHGPEDFEYRKYKMLSHSKAIEKMLEDGMLWDALTEADAVLDFLYQYDAERMIDQDVLSSTKLTDANWSNIELVYTTGAEMASESVLDELVEVAIELYENIHSIIREEWRKLDAMMDISHSGNRPYFINDGFVLISTPDNMIHIYSFNNPSKYYVADWKKFKLEYHTTEKYTPERLLSIVSEIKEKDADKIVYRVNLKSTTKLEGGPINVVSSNIFMRLRKDYGF